LEHPQVKGSDGVHRETRLHKLILMAWVLEE